MCSMSLAVSFVYSENVSIRTLRDLVLLALYDRPYSGLAFLLLLKQTLNDDVGHVHFTCLLVVIFLKVVESMTSLVDGVSNKTDNTKCFES